MFFSTSTTQSERGEKKTFFFRSLLRLGTFQIHGLTVFILRVRLFSSLHIHTFASFFSDVVVAVAITVVGFFACLPQSVYEQNPFQ